jgi:hypothetical protein
LVITAKIEDGRGSLKINVEFWDDKSFGQDFHWISRRGRETGNSLLRMSAQALRQTDMGLTEKFTKEACVLAKFRCIKMTLEHKAETP